jgi:D-sedoheptulose 7-phosphate isomerase
MNDIDYLLTESYIHDFDSVLKNFSRVELFRLLDSIRKVIESGGKLLVCGNGGSASTASHFVVDMNKGVTLDSSKGFYVYCLNDNIPLITAISNDISYDLVFSEQVKKMAKKEDLLIVISASGNSKNVINAVIEATKAGAGTHAITGFSGGKIAEICDDCIIVPSYNMQIIEDFHLIIVHLLLVLLNG